MALEYQVSPNDSIFLRLQLKSSDTGLYPQVKIYSIDDPTTVVDTVNLDELSNGLYGSKWTNNGERKKYFTQSIVYTDSAHTIVYSEVRPDTDSINVSFGSTGGAVRLGGGVKSVKVDRLTDDEIRQIVQSLYALLKPELDKKSEFDPSKDKVITDLPPIPPIKFPPIPNVYDIAKSVVNLLDIDTKLNSIKPSDPLKLEEIILAVEQLIKDNKVDNTAELIKFITDNKIDYSKFDEVKQAIIDNKVVVPDQIQPKNYDRDLATLNEKLISLSKVEEERDNIRKIISLININGDCLEIYELYKKITQKEKVLIFNFLAENNHKLLNELSMLSEAEKVVKQIKEATDKNTIFTYLVKIGKINKQMIPFIRKIANIS